MFKAKHLSHSFSITILALGFLTACATLQEMGKEIFEPRVNSTQAEPRRNVAATEVDLADCKKDDFKSCMSGFRFGDIVDEANLASEVCDSSNSVPAQFRGEGKNWCATQSNTIRMVNNSAQHDVCRTAFGEYCYTGGTAISDSAKSYPRVSVLLFLAGGRKEPLPQSIENKYQMNGAIEFDRKHLSLTRQNQEAFSLRPISIDPSNNRVRYLVIYAGKLVGFAAKSPLPPDTEIETKYFLLKASKKYGDPDKSMPVPGYDSCAYWSAKASSGFAQSMCIYSPHGRAEPMVRSLHSVFIKADAFKRVSDEIERYQEQKETKDAQNANSNRSKTGDKVDF